MDLCGCLVPCNWCLGCPVAQLRSVDAKMRVVLEFDPHSVKAQVSSYDVFFATKFGPLVLMLWSWKVG